MSQYIPLVLNASSANCPLCGVYAKFDWYGVCRHIYNGFEGVQGYQLAECSHCSEILMWRNFDMIYPFQGNVPLPNEDLPVDVREDYIEASEILNLSPRGAAANLRLAIQKLCKALGESGDNINSDIKNLVAKGLPAVMQQALDSVRVIGNNAVHPGQIDLKDDVETAHKLFGFINIIASTLITQPKQIAEFYQETLPEEARAAIAKRDKRV